jgi:hypothetical protein
VSGGWNTEISIATNIRKPVAVVQRKSRQSNDVSAPVLCMQRMPPQCALKETCTGVAMSNLQLIFQNAKLLPSS